MEIIVGKYSGFCNGVRYTVEKANEAVDSNQSIYCLGELVHNERVIEDLEKKGMKTISSIEDAEDNSKVIIRAHGEIKSTYDRAEEKGIELLDLTCGKIKAIRTKINNKMDDYFIIIIGKKNHPETLGVQSFSGDDSYILENEEDINEFLDIYKKSNKNKLYIVSQTTFNSDKFDLLIDAINKVFTDEIIVDKTICDATSNRQEETRELSKNVDVMIIVGGKKSSNTKELEVISKENCNRVYLVQDTSDLQDVKIEDTCKVGIMAGASTPEIVVKEIIDYLEGR
ncbi:MAG: 4-hydroxy-3-methylbut-2-enyl diphosphate reductase [Bacilli bacterium]|nr:4-hydroxy-3-methylbut-2-enyl diphosphate reductase [Bacilli bacterium]